MQFARSLALYASLLALSAGSARAQTTWYVDAAAAPGGDGSMAMPFQSIQTGIAAAAVDSGDVVLVEPGVYGESIDFLGKNIRVDRWGAAGTTRIAPSGGRGVTITGPDWGHSQVLANVVVSGGAAGTSGSGGGLFVSGASPRIVGCAFENNTAGVNGGGAFVASPSTCLIEDCLFVSNSSPSVFGLSGGGLRATAGTIVRDSSFLNNVASNGGGARGNAFFEDCLFQGNRTRGNGGGVSGIVGVRCEIIGNIAGDLSIGVGGFGGGAYASALTDCTLASNDAYGDGGGASNCTLTRCTLSANDALGLQGNFDGDGGGASFSTLTDCSVTSNFAGEGGGTNRGTATGTIFSSNFAGSIQETRDTDLLRCIFHGTQTSGRLVEDGSVDHCVFWGNEILPGFNGSLVKNALVRSSIVRGNQGVLFGTGVTVTYSNVEGGTPGTGNIDAPARFWAPDAPEPDFHLLPGSPCIDAADPTAPVDPDGTRSDMGAFPFDATWCGPGCDGPIGASYCGPANPNSTGGPAVLSALGSETLANELVILRATIVPAGRFGYFLMSDAQGFIPLFGGSQGDLCLGPPQIRFAQDVLTSTSYEEMAYQVDVASLPQGTVFQPGETWNFQLWFRDVNPGVTSNTSDGVALTFL